MLTMCMLRSLRHTTAALAAVGALGIAAPAFAQRPAAATPDPALQRRFHLKVMEGVLVSAVRHGAELLGSELRPINPNLVLLAGTARARGFILDGYGVFFDVEIPALRESVAWTIRTMLGPDPFVVQSLEQMKRQVATLPQTPARANLEKTLAAIERQVAVGGVAGAAQMAAGNTAAGAQAAPPLADSAAATRVAAARESEVLPSAAALMPPQPAPQVVRDPNQLYTEAVKNALTDAMLDHGGPMGIAADEWLTIAAKDAEGPLTPNEPYEASTIVLRIKGSDLAAFRADRITREEARRRVEVREF